ncbi:MAG: hypothetical protein KJO77_08270, partial [Bacteroidia bacterium]|nr:hypothetical protein [Bacteroidia bacterium]
PIDTVYLDENNRFHYTLENLNPGLYSFVHGEEYQVILLEPNDSIMIRLNTYDFDESLVFTGKGSKKNNFLIELFIEQEVMNETMYELSELAPEDFVEQLDSIHAAKEKKLRAFFNKHQGSRLFQKVASACINYNHYAQKEIYPFRYFGKRYVSANMLPEGYFDFRKDIIYNDEDLKDFYPYYNFLFPHFNNLALTTYIEKSKDSLFDSYSIDYHLNKLELIDSLISVSAIKSNLLKYSTRNFLSRSRSPENSEAMYASFMDKCKDEESVEYVTYFYNTLLKLKPGNQFPNIDLVDKRNKELSINSIVTQPTVVYFWSKANKHHSIDSHQTAKKLKEQYPEINFISVNVNNQNISSWQRYLRKNKFNSEHEYMLRNPEVAKKILALSNVYKVIIIDETSEILVANANMFSMEFKEVLAELSGYTIQ